jgi:hypothetical protein
VGKVPALRRLMKELSRGKLETGFDFSYLDEERDEIFSVLTEKGWAFEEIGEWTDDLGIKHFCVSICKTPELLKIREAER